MRHKCGKCKLFGHGQVECGKEYNFANSPGTVSVSCDIIGCYDPWSHTTQGHDCLYCNKKEGHLKLCPVREGFPIYETRPGEQLTILPGTFLHRYCGMGCSEYFRKLPNRDLEYFFMHSDSWGQYGEDTSEVPQLMAFLYGFKTMT